MIYRSIFGVTKTDKPRCYLCGSTEQGAKLWFQNPPVTKSLRRCPMADFLQGVSRNQNLGSRIRQCLWDWEQRQGTEVNAASKTKQTKQKPLLPFPSKPSGLERQEEYGCLICRPFAIVRQMQKVQGPFLSALVTLIISSGVHQYFKCEPNGSSLPSVGRVWWRSQLWLWKRETLELWRKRQNNASLLRSIEYVCSF